MLSFLRAPASKNRPKARLRLEPLEAREVPAVTIQFDYSHDLSGFFNDPSRRAVLQQAADAIASHLDANLPALIAPAGSTWAETFFDPATGQQATVNNPIVGANALVVYVGGRPIGGSEAGVGGSGGYSASGAQGWLNALAARGPGGSLLWGGSIAFDTGTNWWFGSAAAGIAGNQVDFYSVAAHELGHVLGIGTAPRWFSESNNGSFFGASADSLYGGPVPLSPDGAHWADGLAVGGQGASLDPTIQMGTRVVTSPLDFAGLHDLGWSVSGVAGVPSGGSTTSPPTAPPVPPFTPPPLGNPGSTPVVLTGPTDGSAQAFDLGPNDTLTPTGSRMYPFPGFTGVIRSTVADFNGDGVPDYAFATGAGAAGTVRIFDGKTGADILPPTTVLGGFTGGIFLAAGDVNRDGKAELAVSADYGGGPRVQVFKVSGGGLSTLADFIAFGLPDFRGGSRVAMGDVNRDGAADLLVGAGIGGGPRVSVYSGASLAAGHTDHLVPDFFALDPTLRSGVYVSTADLDGDGYSDILYSTGTTGGPRVRVVSGALLIANPGADVATLPAMADFFALDPNDRHGIRIATRDLDGDGKAELIVGSGDAADATVRVIPLGQMSVPTTPLENPFGDPRTIDGVYVG